MAKERSTGPYHLFMLGLCTYVLAALAIETLVPLAPETIEILDHADIVICGIFFLDFLRSLVRAKSRSRYFLTWGWLDLISSIPAIDMFRWGRAARIFRVLRALRATRLLASIALEQRAKSAFWATSFLAVLVIIFGSIAIIQLEGEANASNISSGTDALWWSFVTVTTVGYGDFYPVTPAGRILAGLMMVTGIGLFGTFTACIATSFVETGESEQARQLRLLRQEVAELRTALQTQAPVDQEAVRPSDPDLPANG